MTDVHGVYAAAITPRGKHGEIDFGASFELIDFLCRGGVSGIALCTAAGEFAALSLDERSRLVYLAVKRSRVPVLVGVGSATLDGSVNLAREARDAGAAGLLLPPPHFFDYDQDDLREFYLQFARQLGDGTATFLSQLPLPGGRLEIPTALELLATGHFAGVEDGDGADSVHRIQAACQGRPWRILAGGDATFAEARCAGAHAAISSTACALPELMTALDRAPQDQRLHARLDEFLCWVDQFPPPVIVKTATSLRRLKTGPLSVPLSPEKQKKLEQFRVWFEPWLACRE
ncbi:MAG: dihydrodipicolinate synthase family protein [Candidatus Sulfopaludibacter sp.]|nr:dihydrodipicolinate synthase family protein [Candidatus Sulfopaludibacter sp.]